jgi:hypothetical protein
MDHINLLTDLGDNTTEFMAHDRAHRDDDAIHVTMNIRTTYAAIFHFH